MGKIDAITKEYLKRNDIFADVINYAVYGGEQVVQPDELIDQDPAELTLPYGDDGNVIAVQKFRDLLKGYIAKEYRGRIYAILGVESQAHIHYAMPVKVMLYENINYAAQISAIRKKHRKSRQEAETSEEFLSGFHKEDRLVPVITVTIYWGEKDWDGPRTLEEMIAPVDEKMSRFIPKYELPLITPKEIKDYKMFHTEIGQVMEMLRVSGNKQIMTDLLANNPLFEKMSRDAAVICNELLGLELKIEDKEVVNMSKAWEDYGLSKKTEGRAEGLAEGRAEGQKAIIQNMLADHVPHDKIKQYTHATDAEIAEAEEEMLVK